MTDRPVVASGYRPSPRPLQFSFGLLLALTIEYEIEPRPDDLENHQVVAVSYAYEILDREERELIAYHWHPAGISPVTDPHLHLSGRLAPLEIGPARPPSRSATCTSSPAR